VFRFAAVETLRDDGQVFACDTSATGKRRRAYTLREPLTLVVSAFTPFHHPLTRLATRWRRDGLRPQRDGQWPIRQSMQKSSTLRRTRPDRPGILRIAPWLWFRISSVAAAAGPARMGAPVGTALSPDGWSCRGPVAATDHQITDHERQQHEASAMRKSAMPTEDRQQPAAANDEREAHGQRSQEASAQLSIPLGRGESAWHTGCAWSQQTD